MMRWVNCTGKPATNPLASFPRPGGRQAELPLVYSSARGRPDPRHSTLPRGSERHRYRGIRQGESAARCPGTGRGECRLCWARAWPVGAKSMSELAATPDLLDYLEQWLKVNVVLSMGCYLALRLVPLTSSARVIGGGNRAILAFGLAAASSGSGFLHALSNVQLAAFAVKVSLQLATAVIVLAAPFYALSISAALIESELKSQMRIPSIFFDDEVSAFSQLLLILLIALALQHNYVYELGTTLRDVIAHSIVLPEVAGASAEAAEMTANFWYQLDRLLILAANISIPICVVLAIIEIALASIDRRFSLAKFAEFSAPLQLCAATALLYVAMASGKLFPAFYRLGLLPK